MDLNNCISKIKQLRSEFKIGEAIEFSKKYMNIYKSAELYNEVALCYYICNLEGKSQFILEKALKKVMNYDEYKSIMENLKVIYINHQNKYITYPKDIIQNLKNKKKTGEVIITFTITTCKRFDLFEKTMNSFLNCCLDYILIDRWVCVDDNSSLDDLNKMKEKYPFFEIISKNESEKGHAKSMNIIKQSVNSPYIFHMEDDWQFFVKRKYITDLLRILEFEGPKCGQVLINKNYSEILDIDIIGGIPNATNNNIVYLKHEYYKGEELEINNKRGINCFYWPHYSLRPSIIRKNMLDEVGNYNENCNHFEMEYANRYVEKEYYSCFLDGIFCKHIGKLTFESKSDKPNAYVLNNIPQFSNEKSIKIENYFINLDRRNDRYQSFINDFKNYNFNKFSAIDGNNITYTSNLGHIFSNNDYNYRRGIVGCALSHINLMIQLIKSDCDYYVILEDDAKKTIYFDKMFTKICNLIPKLDIDVLFLHTFLRENKNQTGFVINIMNTNEWHSYSFGSTAGYIISKNGAKKFLEFINNKSFTNAIDTEIFNSADILKVGVTMPLLLHSDMANNLDIDTDIQKNYESISNISKYLELEIEYFKNIGYNQVDDISKLENNTFLISDSKKNDADIHSYKLYDKWITLKIEDYNYLLDNGLRLKNKNEYLI